MNVEDIIKESLGIEGKKQEEDTQVLLLKELKKLNENLETANKNSEKNKDLDWKVEKIYEAINGMLGNKYDTNGFLQTFDEINNLKSELKSEIDKMSDRIKNQVDVNGKIIEDTINKKMR